MKLIFAIVQNDDVKPLTRELVKHEISVTRIASTGGFLRNGNTTLVIGVKDEVLDDVLDVIKTKSRERQTMTTPVAASSHMGNMPTPVPIRIGGATVFILDVEQFYKF